MNVTYGSVFLDKRKEKKNGRKFVAARTRKINFIFGNFDRSFMKMPRTTGDPNAVLDIHNHEIKMLSFTCVPVSFFSAGFKLLIPLTINSPRRERDFKMCFRRVSFRNCSHLKP